MAHCTQDFLTEKIFIFTEAFNCGKVLRPTLNSFHSNHDAKVCVFGTPEDFNELGPIANHENNFLIDLSKDRVLRRYYRQGHLGTAYIFAKVLNGDFRSSGIEYIIHFDSDLYFRKSSLGLILQAFSEGYHVVGPTRCYKNNLNNREDVRHLPDVVQTFFMGFALKKLSKRSFKNLIRMCQGSYEPYGLPVLDFFDPISFDLYRNGAKFKYLDFNLVGGLNHNGSKKNFEPTLNRDLDFGKHMIHFAGVGSGFNFLKNSKTTSVPDSYVEWAKKRYAFFAYIFFGEEFAIQYDKKTADRIKNLLQYRDVPYLGNNKTYE